MTREQAQALVKKHGGINKAAAAAGLSRHAMARRLAKATGQESKATAPRKTLADFREVYDRGYFVPKKIKSALMILGNSWEYEPEIARMAGVSLIDLGRVRDQFADHVIQLGRESRRAWCGSKTMAAQMRSMV